MKSIRLTDTMAILFAAALGVSEYANDMRWALIVPAMLLITVLFVNSRMQDAYRFNIRLPEVWVAIGGLVGLPALSLFLSPDPYISLIDAMSYSVLFAAVLVASHTHQTAFERLPVVAAIVMLPFVGQGLVQVLQPGVNAHGGMHDSNLYAGFLTAGAALIVFHLVSKRHAKRSIFTYGQYILAAVLISGAYVGHSRGAWLALTVATSLTLLATKRHTGLSYLRIALIGGVIAIAGGVCTTHKMELDVAQHDGYGQSTNSRLAMWQATARMIKDHPLAGVGFGLWHIEYPNYRLASDTDSAGFHAHNDYLEAFATGGVAGGLLVLSIPALWAYGLWRVRRTNLENPWSFVGASVASGIFILQASVNFEYHDLAPTLLAGLSLGLMFSHLRKGTPISARGTAARVVGAGATLIVTSWVLLTYLTMAPTLIIQDPRSFEGRYLTGLMNPRTLLFLAKINPFSADAYFALAQQNLVKGITEPDVREKSVDFARALMYFKKTEQRQGLQAGTAYKRAMLALLMAPTSSKEGARQAAELLRVSLSRNPGYWPSVNAYARLESQQGTRYLALPVLARAEEVVPMYQRRNIQRLRSEMLSGKLGNLY